MSFWNDVPTDMRAQLYDLSHITYVVLVVFSVFLFVKMLNFIKNNEHVVNRTLLYIYIIQVVVFYSWSAIELGFGLEAGLPIHMCRISILLGIYYLITKKESIFHILFYTSFFALIAIFYPSNVHPLYTHVVGYTYQVGHLVILLVWIMGVYVYDYVPTYNVMNKVFSWFVIIVVFIGSFNYLVGNGEYLYLRGDVNRPFLTDLPDLVWISIILPIAYLIMLSMTYFVRKSKGIVDSNS